MHIMIVNCHTSNRGDEAANKALVDEINRLYPGANITMALFTDTVYPGLPENVEVVRQLRTHGKKGFLNYCFAMCFRGKVMVDASSKNYINALKKADIVIHSPGGPSIGDIYYDDEIMYLRNFTIIRHFKKKYMFFSPSMGPFHREKRNRWRRKILLGAERVIVRDPISKQYLDELIPEKEVGIALDSALQHDFDTSYNEEKRMGYKELSAFLEEHPRCVGVTITDLSWHPLYGKDKNMPETIRSTFDAFFDTLVEKGYGIVFIPQLYGNSNDIDLMSSYRKNNRDYFVICADDDRYDSYFQQYVISKLYAVVGMRYHSNIFSAKAGTPFLSVSYEQKMKGFMEKMSLDEYCIPIQDLDADALTQKFKRLEEHYDAYKNTLLSKHMWMKEESSKAMKALLELLH